MTLEFVDPPARKHRDNWNAFVEELKQHPDRWVLWKRASYYQNAVLIRKRFPQIVTECRIAEGQSKVYDIYVMWKGEADA